MKVLVVDDQVLFRECLVKAIDSQPDLKIIGQTGSLAEGITLTLNLRPDVVLLGTESVPFDGLEAIETILYNRPETKIVMLSSNESDDLLFAAIRYGAKGYIPKDIPLEHVLSSLRALERDEPALSRTMTSRLVKEYTRLGKLVDSREYTGLDMLTAREIEIIEQLAGDATNAEIAERLKISQNTVKVHISHILAKLDLRNRHEIGRFARRQGVSTHRANPPDTKNPNK